jgi:hypothetical protein
MHAQSRKMLAQLGTALETWLAGMCQQLTPSGLADLPSIPLLVEAGRQGRIGLAVSPPSLPGQSTIRPTRAGGRGPGLGAGGAGQQQCPS